MSHLNDWPQRKQFVSPGPSCSPRRGILRVDGKHNSLFPEGPLSKYFVIPPNSKKEKKLGKNDLLDALAYGGRPRSNGA